MPFRLMIACAVAAWIGGLATFVSARTTTRPAPRPPTGMVPLRIVEVTFRLPEAKGNPFDHTANDVRVSWVGAVEDRVAVPAFFDGDGVWRARHAGREAAAWRAEHVTLNGQRVDGVEFRPADVARSRRSESGFVRLDPRDTKRFVFDDGSPFYPVGYNLGWRHVRTIPPLTQTIAKMGTAGVNWTRIWMNYWDGKNLDWAQEPGDQPPVGELSLAAARQWDEILAAAEESGVHVQMVLQHHGQWGTRNDTNWKGNPWNKENGGWLESPVDFFRDAKAIALTKAKYRYIIARWGYSPAVMAWELFNEAEYADAWEKDRAAVVAWHGEMAGFIRAHDPYGHLVTTSSSLADPALWEAMDYYQAHVYAPDVLTAVRSLDAKGLSCAYFYGEIGGAAQGPQSDPAGTLHRALWGSLMSRSSGAAQYWFWDLVESEGLLSRYASAVGFLRQPSLLDQFGAMGPIDVRVETTSRAPLRFGPGAGWAPAAQTQIVVRPDGRVEGSAGLPAYLQGQSKNREMFPYVEFAVDYPASGTFTVRVDEMTREGVRLEVSVDGERRASVEMGTPPAGGQDRANRHNVPTEVSVAVPVPAGRHVIRLENRGRDWVRVREFELTPYAPELAVAAKGTDRAAVLWVSRREAIGDMSRSGRMDVGPSTAPAISGTLRVPGLSAGRYRVAWWDTYEGRVVGESTEEVDRTGELVIRPPPVERDVAAWISREPVSAHNDRGTPRAVP